MWIWADSEVCSFCSVPELCSSKQAKTTRMHAKNISFPTKWTTYPLKWHKHAALEHTSDMISHTHTRTHTISHPQVETLPWLLQANSCRSYLQVVWLAADGCCRCFIAAMAFDRSNPLPRESETQNALHSPNWTLLKVSSTGRLCSSLAVSPTCTDMPSGQTPHTNPFCHPRSQFARQTSRRRWSEAALEESLWHWSGTSTATAAKLRGRIVADTT